MSEVPLYTRPEVGAQSSSTNGSTESLVAELYACQIELEVQKEQLRLSQFELEKSRDRYVDFYDFAPVGYLSLNSLGLITEINLTGACMLGVERSGLVRSSFSPFVATGDRDHWHRHFMFVLRSNDKRSCELVLQRRDTGQFHARLDCLCLNNDNDDVVVRVVLTDISESICAKNALQESEQKFRILTDAMPQLVWINEPDGWNIYCSQQWVDYTGLTLEESSGHGWSQTVHPDDMERVWEEWQHAALTDTPFSLECRLRRADGVYRWWLVRGVSRHDEDGNIINWFGTCTDISESKKTEKLLLNSLRQLEKKERAKARFLAAAGHDLRQPVAAAGLFVYALKHTHPTVHQSELIEKLSQSMKAFSDLLKQLLDISKFDAGVVKPDFKIFNLADLSDWLEIGFASTALEKNLKFHQFFPTDTPLLVRTDTGLLRSLLMNLISNAIKFTAYGGVLVSARSRGERILVQVWDTGIGISQMDVPLIFDEFYQVGNPQRSRDSGLGLGLFICQRAMALLGGEITCRSKPGRGSVFEFSLPLANARRETEPLADPSYDVDCEMLVQGKRVVVLEDDELVASGMISLLRMLGADVRHFCSAEEALVRKDILNAEYYIVDYALRGELTGIGFLEILQKKSPTPVRAIVVTGSTSSEFIASVANCRWPLMHKPVDFPSLAAALCSCSDKQK